MDNYFVPLGCPGTGTTSLRQEREREREGEGEGEGEGERERERGGEALPVPLFNHYAADGWFF